MKSPENKDTEPSEEPEKTETADAEEEEKVAEDFEQAFTVERMGEDNGGLRDEELDKGYDVGIVHSKDKKPYVMRCN